MLVAIQLTD